MKLIKLKTEKLFDFKVNNGSSERNNYQIMEKLRSIEEIPLKYRRIFDGYKCFNNVQSKVFEDVLRTTKSIIVSAPTGSGKTVVFELAIIQLLMNLPEHSDFKIVYVAPIKALCSEKYLEWSRKFNALGVLCREVTGDSNIVDFNELINTKLIITTPEKWDSLTRKWRDNEDFVSNVRLFLIDEVHLLNEDVRGPILETIVSRMKTIQFSIQIKATTQMHLRFVAASATIPNIEDIATWIGGKDPISYFNISEEQRPVRLEKYILGFNSSSSGFKFDMSLNYKLSGIIRRYSSGKPTLIFCSSRKSVEMASAVLIQESMILRLSDNHKSALVMLSKKLQNNKLQALVLNAIAFHHAGLGHDDRNLIEEGFRQSLILVLVSTNTLAMGINLPAHLVIIKSTETFIRGAVIEYSQSSILQMIGRAGRPQYDVKGVAVIMTQQKNVKKYENLMNGCTPVESHLHKHLAEHLNSEIVLHTITDLEVAMEWIRSTFLYVRAIKCPANYGLSTGLTRDRVEKKLQEMCLIQINALETHGLITKDQAFGLSLVATQYGRLMARYYISFETMKIFRKINGKESLQQILNVLVSSKEFSEFTIRVNDKKTLNTLNSKSIRFPIKGKVKSVEDKVSCLLQAILGNISIPEQSLVQDAIRMTRQGERIAKCLAEYIRLSDKRINGGIFNALLNSVIIMKCLKAKLWENSEYVCKQLKKIGTIYANLLVNAGKTTLQTLIDTDPRTFEMILGKSPPFGNEIHEGLAAFPEYNLKLRLKSAGVGEVIVRQTKESYQYDKKSSSLIIIGDTENNLLLFNDKVDATIEELACFEKTFKIPNSLAQAIHAHLVHDNFVGVDKMEILILNPLDDFEADKRPKRKVQTNLKTTARIANTKSKKLTTTKSKSLSNTTTNCVDNVVSLFDDDDYFCGLEISTQINEKINDRIEVKIKKSECSQSSLKRKLDSFEYFEKPKINKITNNKNDDLLMFLDDNFNDTLSTLEMTLDVDKEEKCEGNDSQLKNSELKTVNVLKDVQNTKIFRARHVIENSSLGEPKVNIQNKENYSVDKKRKMKNSLISDYLFTVHSHASYIPEDNITKVDGSYHDLATINMSAQKRLNALEKKTSRVHYQKTSSHTQVGSSIDNTPNCSDIQHKTQERTVGDTGTSSRVMSARNIGKDVLIPPSGSNEHKRNVDKNDHSNKSEVNIQELVNDKLSKLQQYKLNETENVPQVRCPNRSNNYHYQDEPKTSSHQSSERIIFNIDSSQSKTSDYTMPKETSNILSNINSIENKIKSTVLLETSNQFPVATIPQQNMVRPAIANSWISTPTTTAEQNLRKKNHVMLPSPIAKPLNLSYRENEILDLSKNCKMLDHFSSNSETLDFQGETTLDDDQPLELVVRNDSVNRSHIKTTTNKSSRTSCFDDSNYNGISLGSKINSDEKSPNIFNTSGRSSSSSIYEIINPVHVPIIDITNTQKSSSPGEQGRSNFTIELQSSAYQGEFSKQIKCDDSYNDINLQRNRNSTSFFPDTSKNFSDENQLFNESFLSRINKNQIDHGSKMLSRQNYVCDNNLSFFTAIDYESSEDGKTSSYTQSPDIRDNSFTLNGQLSACGNSNESYKCPADIFQSMGKSFESQFKSPQTSRNFSFTAHNIRKPSALEEFIIPPSQRRNNAVNKITEIPLEIRSFSKSNTTNNYPSKKFQSNLPMIPANIFTPLKKRNEFHPFHDRRPITAAKKCNFIKASEFLNVHRYPNRIQDEKNIHRESDPNYTKKISMPVKHCGGIRNITDNMGRNLKDCETEKDQNKESAKEDEIVQSVEQHLNQINSIPDFFSFDSRIQDISDVVRKQPHPFNAMDILKSICDNRLSKDLENCKIPDNLETIAFDDDDEKDELSEIAGKFLSENDKDKKFRYSKELELNNKTSKIGQIFRIPDLKQTTTTTIEAAALNSNEISKFYQKPNEKFEFSLFGSRKKTSHGMQQQLNEYSRPGGMLRRQKLFAISKSERNKKSNLDEKWSKEFHLNSLNRKCIESSSDAKNYILKECIPVKQGNVRRSTQDNGNYENNDRFLDTLRNKWVPPRTKASTFIAPHRDRFLEEQSSDYDYDDEDDVSTISSCNGNNDDNFARFLSQNLSRRSLF